MPATRPHLDRDVKRRQILDAAEKLLLRHGYERTKMAEVAAEAGVANNAVYWYFASKDDLLASMLQRRQEQALQRLPSPGTTTVEERVLAMLALLDEVAILTATVHERAAHSPAVAEMHEAFHREADRLLQDAFADSGLDAFDASQAAKAMMALVEGIHLHQTSRDIQARDDLVRWTLRRFIHHDDR
jgi:AcrR family transcriptional regulator